MKKKHYLCLIIRKKYYLFDYKQTEKSKEPTNKLFLFFKVPGCLLNHYLSQNLNNSLVRQFLIHSLGFVLQSLKLADIFVCHVQGLNLTPFLSDLHYNFGVDSGLR